MAHEGDQREGVYEELGLVIELVEVRKQFLEQKGTRGLFRNETVVVKEAESRKTLHVKGDQSHIKSREELENAHHHL